MIISNPIIHTKMNKPYQATNSVAFCAVHNVDRFTKNAALAEKGYRNMEFWGRKLLNKFAELFNGKIFKDIHSKIAMLKNESSEYIQAQANAGRMLASKMEVEINLESGRLQNIAKDNSARIFIMNHDSQKHDPKSLLFFNTLLNDEYVALGKGETCPRAKIILNEDILLSLSDVQRDVYEKLGAVGIDASVFLPDGKKNAKALVPLIRDFLQDKVNIFIFPEGKMAVFSGKKLIDKFQTGIADIVYTLLSKKESVKVTPLGFAYGKKNPLLSSLHIGEDIVFKKVGDNVSVTRANITSNASSPLRDFFGNEPVKLIQEQGIPVNGKENTSYIAGVLCENLNVCVLEAKKVLPKTSLGESVQLL